MIYFLGEKRGGLKDYFISVFSKIVRTLFEMNLSTFFEYRLSFFQEGGVSFLELRE
jgi:hypothetical protein